MTKFFFFLALSSIVIFSSCSIQEVEETTIPITAVVEIPVEEAVAEFSIDNTNSQVFEKDAVLITNSSTNAASYHWDFGNGDTSTEAIPDYSYENHGIFAVTLVVTDRDGNTKELSKDITVICLFDNEIHGNN